MPTYSVQDFKLHESDILLDSAHIFIINVKTSIRTIIFLDSNDEKVNTFLSTEEQWYIDNMTAVLSSTENEVYRVQYTAKKQYLTLKETWMKEITVHL